MLLRPYHLLLLSIWIALAVSTEDPPTDASTTDSTASTASSAIAPGPPVPKAIYFPVLTMSVKDKRPAPFGIVKSKSGKVEKDFYSDCKGNPTKDEERVKMEMDPWSEAESGKMVIKLDCNLDSTYFALRESFQENQNGNCKDFLTCERTVTDPKDYCNAKEEPIFGEINLRKDGYALVDPFCGTKEPIVTPQHRWGHQEEVIGRLGKMAAKNYPEPPGDLYIQMPVKQEASESASIEKHVDRFIAHVLYTTKGQQNPLEQYLEPSFDCKDGCKYGRHMLVEYKSMETEILVHLNGKCDWFTVCTAYTKSEGKCKYESTVNVMVRNGFVSFDSRREQALLKMVRAPIDDAATYMTKVALTIVSHKTYQDTTQDTREATKFAHMAVTSAWRQRVVGRINVGDFLLLTFPKPDCLHENFGLRAQVDVKVPIFEYEKTDAAYEQAVKEKNKDNKPTVEDTTKEKIVADEIAEATTVAPLNVTEVTAVETTTPLLTMPLGSNVGEVKQTGQEAEHASKEGQSTWALFYGWLIGSFAAIFCMAPAMFLMRRMLYANWYRGIYKRYGCDASGATGGITGAAFAATGAETTGMQTIGTQMVTTGGSDTSTMQSQISQLSQVSQATSTGGGGDTTTGGGSTMQS